MNDKSVKNRVHSVWKSYRNTIYKNCTTARTATGALEFWRNNLFATTLLYLLPLSLIAFIPGIYAAYIEGLTFLLLADFIAICCLLTIAFVQGIKIYTRKLIFCIALYQVSLALLFYLGTFGPGLLYLLAISVFVVLIFEKKYGIGVVVLNTLVCVVFAFASYFQWWEITIYTAYNLQNWVAVSSNLVFLSFLAVLLIPTLFNGLQETIDEQDRLKSELERNQQKLKISLQQLEDKNSELEDFAYTASHDMKEPLRMVQSFLKLLSDRYNDQIDEKGQKYIYFAVDGAKRLSALIDDLLEYSRIGRTYDSFEEVDLTEVIAEVKNSFKYDIESKNALITYSNMPVINAVPVSVKMLFQNLVSNALKYQEKDVKPEIEISCRDRESHWEFKVSDNGIGIKEEYFDQIFQIFNRLHANNVYSGTGIGLAICKKIVNQHGGKIWVKSTEGKGTDFIFTLEKRVYNESNTHTIS